MDMNLGKLRELVKDREASCAAVHGVSKSQTWFGDFPTQGLNPHLLYPLHSDGFFTTSTTWEAQFKHITFNLSMPVLMWQEAELRQECKWWGAAENMDESSLASPLLTSCYTAWFLTGHGPKTVHDLGIEEPCLMGMQGVLSKLPPSCRPGNFRLIYLKFYSWERLKLLLADIKSWLGLAQVTPFGAACFLLTSIMKEQRRKWHEGAVAFILLSLQRYGSSSSHLSPQV